MSERHVLKEARGEIDAITTILEDNEVGYHPTKRADYGKRFDKALLSEFLQRQALLFLFSGHRTIDGIVLDTSGGVTDSYGRVVFEGTEVLKDSYLLEEIRVAAEMGCSPAVFFLNSCGMGTSYDLAKKIARYIPFVIFFEGLKERRAKGGGTVKDEVAAKFSTLLIKKLVTAFKSWEKDRRKKICIETIFCSTINFMKSDGIDVDKELRPKLVVNGSLVNAGISCRPQQPSYHRARTSRWAWSGATFERFLVVKLVSWLRMLAFAHMYMYLYYQFYPP